MKVLLTGASSFTGAWFAAVLARGGHAVTGTLQGLIEDYSPLARLRIALMQDAGVVLAEGVSYGNPAWFGLVDSGFEVLGYHGGDIRDYRSPDFDVARALAENTAGIAETCRRGVAAGLRRIVYTGTVAEPHEGGGDAPERAMSPYGLSKSLTWEVLREHTRAAGLALGKFVIANPFGRYEQDRFCSYLVRSWAAISCPAACETGRARSRSASKSRSRIARTICGSATTRPRTWRCLEPCWRRQRRGCRNGSPPGR